MKNISHKEVSLLSLSSSKEYSRFFNNHNKNKNTEPTHFYIIRVTNNIVMFTLSSSSSIASTSSPSCLFRKRTTTIRGRRTTTSPKKIVKTLVAASESSSNSNNENNNENNNNNKQCTGSCDSCGLARDQMQCDGTGRIQGGLAAVPLFSWWPIKAYRPCPGLIESGGTYTRKGQDVDSILWGENGRD